MRNTLYRLSTAIPLPFRLGAILLCVGAMGCASAPRTYADGAPIRTPVVEPVTSFTPAGAGLPEYWGSPVSPALEPNPKPARVLPETPSTRREPGVWAGDQPVASARPFTPPLLMEAFPVLPEDAPQAEHGVLNSCAANLRLAADAIGATAGAANIAQRTRRCLVARLLWMCVNHDLNRYEQVRDRKEAHVHLAEALDVLGRAERHMTLAVQKQCANERLSDDDVGLLNDVFKAWKERHDV